MAAKGGDSRQGLIVALVLAILFFIGTGVAAYYGYAGQEDLAKDAKKANDAKKSIEKARDWHQFLALQYKAYVGTATKQDLSELSVLRGRYESDAIGKGENNYADNKAAIEKLDRGEMLGWHKGENRPVKTSLEEIGRYETELRELRRKLEASMVEVKQAQDAKRQAEEFAASAAADFKKNLAKLNNDYVTLVNTRQKEFLDTKALYEAENKRVEDVEKKMAAAIEEREKRLALLEAENKKLELGQSRLLTDKVAAEKENVRLRGQVDPVNPLESGPARGKIVRLDRSGSLAWINLGSADNLRAQVRFSVFKDKGDGTPTGDLKASIQVTNIEGDHMSRAQITYVRDPNRNPVLAGDLLYNPTWSPSAREHVAIAGVIDLTGLGTDNTAEFIRSLERQGVEVDAYFDPKDLTMKGKGMTTQTSYLILGEKPELRAGVIQEGGRNEAVQNANARVTQMTEEAAKLGIQVIPYRRYLVLTGHRPPRGLGEAAAPGAYRPPAPEKKAPDAPKKDAGKPDAPKKDNGK